MSLIKKFFQKKKLDIKFKKAGEGHSLNEERQAPTPSSSRGHQAGPVRSPRAPGEEARRAAEAALARQTSRDKDRPGIVRKVAFFQTVIKSEYYNEKESSCRLQLHPVD